MFLCQRYLDDQIGQNAVFETKLVIDIDFPVKFPLSVNSYKVGISVEANYEFSKALLPLPTLHRSSWIRVFVFYILIIFTLSVDQTAVSTSLSSTRSTPFANLEAPWEGTLVFTTPWSTSSCLRSMVRSNSFYKIMRRICFVDNVNIITSGNVYSGVDQLNNILVIGMTNRRDMIDEALMRPGRLEVQMEIGLPDEKGRVQILAIHTKRMREYKKIAEDVDNKVTLTC